MRAHELPGEVGVRRARPREIPQVVELLEEAAARAAGLGYPMWSVPFPRATVESDVARGSAYVVERDGRLEATLALLWDDPPAWGLRPPDAGYVHRFVVRRTAAHQALGARMLDWAGLRVRSVGRRYLRLDTIRSNPRLHRYYEARGFSRVGEVEVNRVPLLLFERSASPVSASGAPLSDGRRPRGGFPVASGGG